jgi:hypothetical protein
MNHPHLVPGTPAPVEGVYGLVDDDGIRLNHEVFLKRQEPLPAAFESATWQLVKVAVTH